MSTKNSPQLPKKREKRKKGDLDDAREITDERIYLRDNQVYFFKEFVRGDNFFFCQNIVLF